MNQQRKTQAISEKHATAIYDGAVKLVNKLNRVKKIDSSRLPNEVKARFEEHMKTNPHAAEAARQHAKVTAFIVKKISRKIAARRQAQTLERFFRLVHGETLPLYQQTNRIAIPENAAKLIAKANHTRTMQKLAQAVIQVAEKGTEREISHARHLILHAGDAILQTTAKAVTLAGEQRRKQKERKNN